jgi:hypothetical protein
MISDFVGIVKPKVENIHTAMDVVSCYLVICGSGNNADSVLAMQCQMVR